MRGPVRQAPREIFAFALLLDSTVGRPFPESSDWHMPFAPAPLDTILAADPVESPVNLESTGAAPTSFIASSWWLHALLRTTEKARERGLETCLTTKCR